MGNKKNNYLDKLINLEQFLNNSNFKDKEYFKSKRIEYFNTANSLRLFDLTQPNSNKRNKRLETRTRIPNPESALSFAIHDPLWMLTRQWQFGEFKGNDAGSAIWAKVKIKHTDIVGFQNETEAYMNANREAAMEYYVERLNHQITEGVKVEAAHHFKKLLDYSDIKALSVSIINFYREEFPLSYEEVKEEDIIDENISAKDTLNKIKRLDNYGLNQFMHLFKNKAFDAFALYLNFKQTNAIQAALANNLNNSEKAKLIDLLNQFSTWFKNTYIPVEENEDFWIDERLAYEVNIATKDIQSNENQVDYIADNYHSGRLSWYSFDKGQDIKESNKKAIEIKERDKEDQIKFFSYIPLLAAFPGAPNKRLWAFEDAKVTLGNTGLDKSDLASAMIMQFTTMYSNDWLVTPLELEVGRISSIEGIIVKDVFGNQFYIDKGSGDRSTENSRYSSRWEMFTIAQHDAYIKNDFSTDARLFYPPSVPRTEESKAIEEIQFLRDEMANMLWAVEMKLNDGTNIPMDGEQQAGSMQAKLNELLKSYSITNDIDPEVDYNYLLQNTVPFNWIPFSPVRFDRSHPNYDREIRFQRSAMPIYLKQNYIPIRPNSQLLRPGINENDKIEAHGFINEEEILSVGTKVSLNYQRARWFDGKAYNWLGAQKSMKHTQANSGLNFDNLIENIKAGSNEIDLNK